MSECPSELVLASYARGELDKGACELLDDHLDQCSSCEQVASRLECEFWALRLRPAATSSYALEAGAAVARQLALEAARSSHSRTTSGLSERSLRWAKLLPGDRVGNFLILSNLGSGGFATVYMAQQESMQRRVALKISVRQSHEAPVLSNLDHSNIVRVYNEQVLPDQETRLLSMQYLPGGSLRQAIQQFRDIPPFQRRGSDLRAAIAERMEKGEEARIVVAAAGLPENEDWVSVVCWFGARIAQALNFAHEKGYYHRDIKPGNILFAADGRPLLADFNLSYGSQVEGACPDKFFGGSDDYMAPEQLEAQLGERNASEVRSASDLYSLGVVLWELLAGQRPFPREAGGKNRESMWRAMADRRRLGISPADAPSYLPVELRETLARLLAPKISDRPDGAELARMLELCSSRQLRNLICPEPTSSWGKCARWPMMTLIILGLLPNVLFALVNTFFIWAYLQDDMGAFVTKTQLPVLAIVFPAGVILPVLIARPMFRALAASRGEKAQSSTIFLRGARICFSVPWLVYVACLILWTFTGLAYAYLNTEGTGQVARQLSREFLVSQLVHGLIASSLTFLTMALGIVWFCLPQLVRTTPLPEFQLRLEGMKKQTYGHSVWIGLVPSLALMGVVLLRPGAEDGGETLSLLFALGAFGAISYVAALSLAPQIQSTLRLLERAVTPLEKQSAEKL
jgi:serine/threonine protein kinase